MGGKEATILLIEDEPDLKSALETLLKTADFDIFSASSWEEADAIVAQRDEPIDVLITDIVLPDKNGIEICEELESLWPDMQTVFVSGYSSEIARRYGDLEGDGRRFLTKPVSPSELFETLDELMA